MRSFKKIIFSIVLVSMPLFFIPVPALAAGLVPCGRSVDDVSTPNVNESDVCTLCHIFIGGVGLIEWGMGIMVVIGIALIMISGIIYIISVGDTGKMSHAKGMIGKVLGGLALILCGWLIVNTIINVLASDDMGIGIQKENWYTFTCDSKSTATTIAGNTAPGAAVGGATAAPGAAGGGAAACAAPDSEKTRMNSGGTVCNSSGVCPACNTSAFDTFITSYGNTAGISLGLIRGLIARESSCVSTAEKSESNGTKSCGLMMVNTTSSTYTCEQLKDPETGIREGVRILKAAFVSAQSLKPQYGNTVTVEELAAAIHNAGAGQSAKSVDCSSATGWPTIPKWGCPINPGTAEFNACRIKNYACNVGACR